MVLLSALLAAGGLWMGSDSSVSSHHVQTPTLPPLPPPAWLCDTFCLCVQLLQCFNTEVRGIIFFLL